MKHARGKTGKLRGHVPPPAIARKIARLQRGGKPRTLDLFSGCGGLGLGFHSAGCEIIGAVESDPDAARTFAENLAKTGPPGFAKAKDIKRLEPEAVLEACGAPRLPVTEAIDIIIGGPPCQAFSRIGRAKLREVARHPEAFKRDPRAALYLRFLYFVKKTLPIAILIENVPDVLNFGGRNVAEEISTHLKDLGYRSTYTLLNSARYGVPQARERMFLVGIHRSIRSSFEFPKPSRRADLPPGYGILMATALGSIDPEGVSQGRRRNPSFVVPPKEAPGLPPAFTSAQAMNDLPAIDARALLRHKGEAGFRLMRLSPPAYAHVARNTYQRLMRNWPDMPAHFGVADHCIRCVPRDFRWFAIMKPGMRYPEIRSIGGLEFYSRILPHLRRRRLWAPMLGTAAFKRFFARHVPPYDPAKFDDKWRMIDPDSPCHTLLAHLGKDCYSHIHYDRRQARTISIREAARLQSFPDGFRFPSSMNASFRQIGNAVPPLLSYAIARALCKAIGSASKHEVEAFGELTKGPLSGGALLRR